MSGTIDLRQAIHAAYAYVHSAETNKGLSGLTLDHLLNEHILSLKGSATRQVVDISGNQIGKTASRLDRLQAMKDALDSVVSAIEQAGSDPEKLEALGLTDDSNPSGNTPELGSDKRMA